MSLARAGVRLGLAGLFMLGASDALQNASAEGDTRTLSFHHVHTGEDITVTFKRDGRYDEAALKKLNWFMRDWRKEQDVQMDPHLFDVLWEAYREVGGTRPIEVICGYRSPETNSMLRARSSGVAQTSQHTSGHAMDFFIPGVPLEKIREVGLRLQRGGVGFYPTSGSPFVHMDTGTVRHWPRMTYAQLSKVFPDGRTVHVPSDGQPLPGYALALADVERRGNAPSSVSLAAARDKGVITDGDERAAKQPTRSLFAGLFGGGKDADEQADAEPASAPAPKRGRMPVAVASLTPPAPKPVAVARIVPLPHARPAQVAAPVQVASAMPMALPKPKPATAPTVVASAVGNMFDKRGYWQGAVESADLPPLRAGMYDVASIETTGSAALAYAATSEPAPAARARPMGANIPNLAREAAVQPAAAAAMAQAPAAMTTGGQRTDNPWLRAAMLTPSVTGFMTATRFGATDPRPLQTLIHKPAQSVVMTFSADQSLGMVADRFGGPAVVFLATTTFANAQTASLR